MTTTPIRTPDDEVTKPGYFTAPFTEGWTYQGQTYAGHSDFSVDWNRRTPSGAWLEDTGDPVLAVADGTVAEVDKSNGLVMLRHAGGYQTEYRHMTGIGVKVGQKVQRSDRIGSIGNVAGDGRSFGAHLHHVHWKNGKRIKMAFEDKPIATSVGDSDTRPEGWQPPAPVALQGPPPKATWQSAFREASAALVKAEKARDGWKEQSGLHKDERDQARRELLDERAALSVQAKLLAEANARILELEQATPADCTTAVNAERQRVLDAMVAALTEAAGSLR